MKIKYLPFLLAILMILSVAAFAQDADFITKDKREGIIQLNAAVSKLHSKMTPEEVKELFGEPTFTSNVSDYYWFPGGEWLQILNSTSIWCHSRYGVHPASSMVYEESLPIFYNGVKWETLKPAVRVDFYNIYLSVQDMVEKLEIAISFDKEKLKPETMTKSKQFGNYTGKPVDFPVYMNGEELLTAIPVIAINGNMYLPLEEILAQLGFNYSFDNEKLHYDIVKEVLPTTPFDKYYAALTFSAPVFVDGAELLTFNPFVTINGRLYLPLFEIEEEFKIKVEDKIDRHKQTYGSVKDDLIRPKENSKIEVTTAVEIEIKDTEEPKTAEKSAELMGKFPPFIQQYHYGQINGIKRPKDREAILRFKADIGKLSLGMTSREVGEVLTVYHMPDEIAMTMSSYPTLSYIHADGGMLRPNYNGGVLYAGTISNTAAEYGLSALTNMYGFNLFATGYIAQLINVPVLIDGEKVSPYNPIVTIHGQTYIPVAALSEQLGVKSVEFNTEKQRYEIVTK